ncbi:N-acyl homoserine lactonase family protein [Sulfitobacter sp. HNIBRBA3233]|uniref:N-acyl homoserine lactonase family protein n=1 Tax=Sulfitobacter marinivivus TaxID=3158558 RepID=UPI0032E04A14
MSPHAYEVYAVQYARSVRPVTDYYLGADPHDGSEPIFYYVWVLRRGSDVILIDTGFDAERARARKRDFLRCPIEALRALDIAPEDVGTVIITHLHYDHAGNMDKLPKARFVLQDEEMRFATGRYMRHGMIRAPFELSDVQLMVALNYAGRVDFVDGDSDLTEGVRLHHIPGHSLGLQAVTVQSEAGRLCLASDAAHFYANISRGAPFPIVADVARTLDGHEKVMQLARDRSRLIPGHDPAVAELFESIPGDDMIFDLTKPKG